jgi:hypothetical protein
MYVPLGRSPPGVPVLRAGVCWGKLDLAWRFRQAAVLRKQPAQCSIHGGGVAAAGGAGGERRR